MTNYRPIDSKREEFRKYLERAGVMDALTKALVSLYEEADKPMNALEYVQKALGDNRPDEAEFQAVKTELEECKANIVKLQEENASLKERLANYEPPEEVATPEEAEPSEPPAEEEAEEPPAPAE